MAAREQLTVESAVESATETLSSLQQRQASLARDAEAFAARLRRADNGGGRKAVLEASRLARRAQAAFSSAKAPVVAGLGGPGGIAAGTRARTAASPAAAATPAAAAGAEAAEAEEEAEAAEEAEEADSEETVTAPAEDNAAPEPAPFGVDDSGRPVWLVEEVLRERNAGRRNHQVLVRWEGFSREQDSWEPIAELRGNSAYAAFKAQQQKEKTKTTTKTKKRKAQE